MSWTPKMLETAQAMWADGESAGAIAAAIGLSRSAVCGMAMRNRDRFPTRGKAGATGSRHVRRAGQAARTGQVDAKRKERGIFAVGWASPSPSRPSASTPLPPEGGEEGRSVLKPREYDSAGLMVPLDGLRSGQCRFAVNDAGPGETHLFCGRPAAHGPYCGHHQARTRSGYSALAAMGAR